MTHLKENDHDYRCDKCPSEYAAAPAIVKHLGYGRWTYSSPDSYVHLAALFRDPEIGSGRKMKVVLDIQIKDGELRNSSRCWMGRFTNALATLPIDICIAIDNCVRCPCGTKRGLDEYFRRAKFCLERTEKWLSLLRTLSGKPPPVSLCDRALSIAMSHLGVLKNLDGTNWEEPKRFVEAVGSAVRFNDLPAMILAHPIVVERRPDPYQNALADAVPTICKLAGI